MSADACCTGEAKDTAELGWIIAAVDKWLPQADRIQLFQSWGSVIGMLPVGGINVWGNVTHARDDSPEMQRQGLSYG